MTLRAVVLSALMVLSMPVVFATPAAAGAAGNASVSPSAVEFGETSVGSTATEDVTITNDGDESVEVTGVEVTGSNETQFAVTSGASGGTIAPDESLTATVKYAPKGVDDHSATLNVSYADGTTSEVPLSGTGTPATISGTVTDFGAPVENATVSVPGFVGGETTTTDADGNYELTVERDFVTLTVYHEFVGGTNVTVQRTVDLSDDTTRDIAFDKPTLADLPGDGSADDPYEIATVRELRAMEDDLNANYALTSDIDASPTVRWNDGRGFEPVGLDRLPLDFEGSFDGRGHTVSRLHIDRPDAAYAGLFASTTFASLQNVVFTNATVRGEFAGALAGKIVASSDSTDPTDGPVSRVRIIDATVQGENTGALAGSSSGSTISRVTTSGTVSAEFDAGGIVGSTSRSLTIRRSFSNATVSSGGSAGGLTGGDVRVRASAWNGTITSAPDEAAGIAPGISFVRNSIATGTISEDIEGERGGLITGNVEDDIKGPSYYDVNRTNTTGSLGTGLTTAEMTGLNVTETMAGLRFYDVWLADESGYPRLIRQAPGQDGTPGAPFEVATLSQLRLVENNRSGSYELTDDVDVGSNGPSVDPIGTADAPFNGTFDGGNNTVSNLTLRRPGEDDLGLFGVLDDATVRRLTLDNATVTGANRTGTLAGTATGTGTTIEDVSVAGPTVEGTTRTGGVVGTVVGGNVTNASVHDAAVTGADRTGGLAGNTTSTTVGNVTIADATVTGGDETGGLVGRATGGTLGNVTIAGGAVTGGNQTAGVAGNATGGTVTNTSVNGTTVTGTNRTGGVVGSYTQDFAAGLVSGPLANVSVDETTVTGTNRTGGVVGFLFESPLLDTTVSGVSVTGTNAVGGAVGKSNGFADSVIANGSVEGDDGVGGVVGENDGEAVNLTADGSVDGGTRVGGVVGANDGLLDVASVTATVTGNESVGGAVGTNTGTLSNVTADGSVEGDSAVAGLAGDNTGTIDLAYTVAGVTGDSEVGGAVGNNSGTVAGVYWDRTVTGQDDSAGGTGLTTAEMTDVAAVANMTGLDFETGWAVTERYPVLAQRYDGALPIPFRTTIRATNGPVLTGETLTVAVRVENLGDFTATDRLDLLGIDGTEVDGTDVTLLGGGATDITLTWTPETAQSGDVTLVSPGANETTAVTVGQSGANFDATITDANNTVTTGDRAVVEYRVENTASSGDEQRIELTADGVTVASETVTLLDGESTTGTLTYTTTAADAPGVTVGVTTDDDIATRDVSVNRVPTATDDSYTATAGETLTVAADGLLANDSDPDGDALAVATTPVASPSNGTVALDADGSFEYTPEDGFVGEDSFTYEVADGDGGTDTATVTVTVTEPTEPANFTVEITGTDAPITAGETLSVAASVTNVGGTAGTKTVTLDAVDETAVDTRSVELAAGGQTGVTLEWTTGDTDDGSGMLTVRTVNDTATRTVTVEASADDGGGSGGGNDSGDGGDGDDSGSGGGDDNDGGSSAGGGGGGFDGGGESDPDDLPEPTDEAYTVPADGTLSVGADDGGLAGEDRSVAVERRPENGTLTLDENGSFTYAPDDGFTGTDSFTYAVGDGLAPATATVTITVTPSSDGPTVLRNESAIRQRLDVPENAEPTVAELVAIAEDGPTTANFTANTTVTSVSLATDADGTLTVVEYAEPPSVYDDVPGATITAMRISGSAAVENATATVRLRVPRPEFQGRDAAALRLAHRVDGAWELLDTTVVSQGPEAVVLSATPSDLSPFAVTAVAQSGMPATPAPQTDTATDVDADGTDDAPVEIGGFGPGPLLVVGAALAALVAVAVAALRRRR